MERFARYFFATRDWRLLRLRFVAGELIRRAYMFGAHANPNEACGNALQQREFVEQFYGEWWLRLMLQLQHARHHLILDSHLEALRNTRGPFPPFLHFAQIVERQRATAQR